MVDKNNAPEGYIAIKGSNCEKCAFNKDEESWWDCMLNTMCIAYCRPDKTDVIFIKKET